MKRDFLKRLTVIVVLLCAALPARTQEMQFDQSALVQSLLPLVVNVTALLPTVAPPPQAAGAKSPAPPTDSQQKRQLGSGFVIDPTGVIATNYHVIDGAYQIVATFSGGMQLGAQVIAGDRLADIALLKVNPPSPLKPAQWADSNQVRIGDGVLAIGNPLGVGLSVTGGIISALNRNIMSTPYDDYIQTDAPINHGNSGGPLFDMQGKVVGINTAIISPTAGSAGLGFAIPANDARFVIGQLQRYGWIRPGWLGVKLQQVTPDIAEALGMETPRGSIVSDVMAPSPAANAGIRIGDIILSYAGHDANDERALLRNIASTPPGTSVALQVLEAGKAKMLEAKIDEWPRQRWEKYDAPITPVMAARMIPPNLGLTIGPLTSSTRVDMNMMPSAAGVLVTAVTPNTDAAQRGVVAGDAILRVQNQPIRSTEDFLAALDAARRQHHAYVLVLLLPKQQVTSGPEWRALALGGS